MSEIATDLSDKIGARAIHDACVEEHDFMERRFNEILNRLGRRHPDCHVYVLMAFIAWTIQSYMGDEDYHPEEIARFIDRTFDRRFSWRLVRTS